MLDELLVSLGPYAMEAAVLTGEYENEPCELVVAPTAEAGAAALSHHRLNQIKPMLLELTAQDRQSLGNLAARGRTVDSRLALPGQENEFSRADPVSAFSFSRRHDEHLD